MSTRIEVVITCDKCGKGATGRPLYFALGRQWLEMDLCEHCRATFEARMTPWTNVARPAPQAPAMLRSHRDPAAPVPAPRKATPPAPRKALGVRRAGPLVACNVEALNAAITRTSWTTREVADHADLDSGTISRLRRGARLHVRSGVAIAIERALGVPAGTIFGTVDAVPAALFRAPSPAR